MPVNRVMTATTDVIICRVRTIQMRRKKFEMSDTRCRIRRMTNPSTSSLRWHSAFQLKAESDVGQRMKKKLS